MICKQTEQQAKNLFSLLTHDEFVLISANPLFREIDFQDIPTLLACLSTQKVLYPKDSFILRATEAVTFLGVVLSGRVHIVQEDFWGNRNILTQIAKGEIFAEAFSCAQTQNLPVSAVAAENAAILQLNFHQMMSLCPTACSFHQQLLGNMIQILAEKNVRLTRKMQQISQRSIREKVVSFLSDLAVESRSNELVLPFNRQELADYLCVDRSALSRELGKMRREGILEFEQNHFKLHPTDV